MEKRVAEQEVIDQETFEQEGYEDQLEFEGLSDFLDYVEVGIRDFVRTMLQEYAKDEFMRYIGA
ncbi:hypothetical protein DRH29_05425 [candidate division Kazan bacterium]|uniref:Uncharacterized protein n=1 Tax=candidate division Kazan bacterium TaxID=2202143 RepID=A0A420ZB48_UNCK3|nr:MAG: hypothetical protein DRH29_05425 [candidate division Kazan bacterium]